MGYAKYVGRVGALAVALGFGAAVATSTPAIAFADGTEPDPTPGTNQDQDPGPVDPPKSETPDPGPVAPPPNGSPAPGGNGSPQENNNNDPETKPGDPEVRAAEPGEVLATGGFQEEEKKPEQPTGTTPPPPPPAPPAPPVVEQHIPPPPPEGESKDPVIQQQTPLLLDDEKSKSKLQQHADENLETTLKSQLAQENTGQLQRSTSLNTIQSLDSNATTMTSFSTAEDEDQPVVQTMAAATTPVSTTPTLRTVFTGLLALVGLGPSSGAGTPSLPFAGTPIFEAIFAFVRRIEATVSNHTPSAKLSDAEYKQNGDMSGVIAVDDDYGDGHTYVISQDGTKGHAVVDADGNVTYTRYADAPAGPDTFVVTVSDDTGFHIHAPGTQHTTTVTVTTSSPVATPNPADGKATGTIPYTNTTGAPVTFTPTNDEKDEFDVNPDGTWTFTPDPETRHDAAKEVGGVTQKTYTVDVKDAQGNVIDTVEVTVPISGANDKPTFVPPGNNATPPQTDPDTGIITGSFQVKDEDLDDLDVEGTSTYGTVTITDQQTDPVSKVTTVYYTVTPPAAQPTQNAGFARMSLMSVDESDTDSDDAGAMRMMAFDESEPESLTTLSAPPIVINFVIKDGYGGSTPLTVTVPVDENGNPQGTTVYSSTNPDTGAIEITVNATDPDGDPLTYTVTDPAKGTLTQTAPNTWVYTPTDAARHQATAVDSTLQDRRDNFTITIDDSQGNSVDVPVTVSLDQGISPTIATSTPVLQGSYLNYVSSPDGKKLYIANFADGSVKVIDTTTNKVVATVPAGTTPYNVAISPSGDRLYVSNFSNGKITVINTADNTVVTDHPIDVGSPPASIIVSPDGNTLYAAGGDQTTGHITVVDTTGTAPNQTISTGNTVLSTLSMSPDGTKLYGTGNTVSGQRAPVTVIDLTNNTATPLSGTTGSVSNALSPDGTKLYVTNDDGKIHIYDTATGTEAAPIDLGTTPLYGISVSPDGRQALVTDGTGTIHVIDTTTGTQTGTIASGSTQQGLIKYTPNGAGAYLLNFGTSGTTALNYISGNTANADPTFTVAPVNNPASGPITYHVDNIGDADGDQVTISVAQPAHGTVAIVGGDYVYTPTDTRVADTITFTATDAHGGTTTHTINVPAATATNHDPDFGDDAVDVDSVATSDGTVTGSVAATDADSDPLTYALGSDGVKGHAVVNADGTWSYTPNPTDRHDAAALGASEADRTDTFTVTVSDGQAGTDTQTVTVNLVPKLNLGNATITPVADSAGPFTTSPDGRYVYAMANDGNGTVLRVIDTSTGAARSIPVEGGYSQPILSRDGAKAYVLTDDGNVRVVDINSGHVDTIEVGGGLTSATLSEDGKHLYVGQLISSDDAATGNIVVIDTETRAVTNTFSTGTLLPITVSATPDGRYVYSQAADFSSGPVDGVLVVDTTTADGNPRVIDVGGMPTAPVVSPNGDRVYVVVNNDDDPDNVHRELVVLDAATGNEVDRKDLGQSGYEIAFNPDGTRAIISDPDDGTIRVVDTATNTVIDTTTYDGGGAQQIQFASYGGSAYFLDGSGSIQRISGNTANAAPTGLSVVPQSGDRETGVVTYALNTDADADGDVVSYVATSPTNGTVVINNGTVTYTPTADPADDQFTIIASDGHGGLTTTEVNYFAPPVVGARVPGTPVGPATLSPNGDRVLQASYVPASPGNPGGTYITVIDTATGQPVNETPGLIPGTIQAGDTPHFNSAGNLAFYTTQDPDTQVTYFTMINLDNGEFFNGGPIPVGQIPTGPIVYSGDRGYLTTTSSPSNPDPSTNVFIFDSEDGIGGTNYRYDGDNSGKLFVGGNDRAYLVVYHDDVDPGNDGTVVKVFDTSSGQLLGQRPIDAQGTRVGDVVIDDVNHRAYLTTTDGNRTWVTVIDSDTGEPPVGGHTTAEITGDASGRSVVLSPDGSRAYQATTLNGQTTITAIDTATSTYQPLTTVTGTGSANIVLDNNDHLYLVTTNSDGTSSTIRSIDTNTGSVLDTVPVGGVASASDRTFLTEDGDLVVVRVPDPTADGTPITHAVIFNSATGTVVTDLETRGLNLAVTEADGRLYVANETSSEFGSNTRIWIFDAHTGEQLSNGTIDVEGSRRGDVVVDGNRAYQVTYDEVGHRMRVAVIDLDTYEGLPVERITLPGSLDDYRFTVEDDGTASLIAYSHEDNDGTTSTTFASVDSTTGDVETQIAPNHAYLVRDADGNPQYLVAAFSDPSTNETFVGVLDVDTGDVVGEPYAVAGQLDPMSLGAVVVDGDGTAYVTTLVQNQDGGYRTRVTPIPNAVPPTSGMRTMSAPANINVVYPEPEDTNPLVPEPFSSNSPGPSEFDMNSLLSV